MEFNKILVTGGCGFIGSNVICHLHTKYASESREVFFLNVDALHYCARPENVVPAVREGNYRLVVADIADTKLMVTLLRKYDIDLVLHFAAQSHVGSSFEKSLQYTQDNVLATHHLLEACRHYGKLTRFVHVSTDEVYGESFLGDTELQKTEQDILKPTNPYAASKAAAEMYVNSYYHSFALPVITVRMNNVYGPRQHWEKLIPRFIKLLKEGKTLTIHGSGEQLRSFVHVDDVSRAFSLILAHGENGEIYNIGGDSELSVLDIARKLLVVAKLEPPFEQHITFVKDRPFNDRRYYISSGKLEKLGWSRRVDFDAALQELYDC